VQGNKICLLKFIYSFIYLLICGLLPWMIGLSANNELKRLCKEVIKTFAWGGGRYPPKNRSVVCVPNESYEIWTQTQIRAIMKAVKLLLLFHPEGGENFTLNVMVRDDKGFVVCVFCNTVLTVSVRYQIIRL
jgi:hypothetical protein